jgi:ketosteroid isomerase-like protein
VENQSEQSVLDANETFYRAFAERDIGLIDTLWARDVHVTCIHPGWNLLSGREEVMASWEAILQNPGQARVVAGGAEAEVLGHAAVVVCREFVAGTALIATNVFVREEGQWRLQHHHSSPVVSPE